MPRTVDEINNLNKRFWRVQRWLMDKRLGTPGVAAAAYALIQEDAKRRIPLAHRRTYEVVLRDAAVAVRAAAARIRSAGARSAGLAKKGDALTKLLRMIVARRPGISLVELKKYLKALEHFDGMIQVTESKILLETEKGDRTQTVEFPLSGLKDRLSRIKREFRVAKSR